MKDKRGLAIANYEALGWTTMPLNRHCLKNGNKLIQVNVNGSVEEVKDFDLLKRAGCLDHENEIIRILSDKIDQLSQDLESLSHNFYNRND